MARRTWYRDSRSGKPLCYRGRYNDCFRPHFAISGYQSDALQAATQQINGVLDSLSDEHPDLAILDAGGVLVLMDVIQGDGATPGESDLTAQDEPAEIWEAFAIESSSSS